MHSSLLPGMRSAALRRCGCRSTYLPSSCPGTPQVRVLQGQAGDQHQLRVELDGRDVSQGSVVELHWCAPAANPVACAAWPCMVAAPLLRWARQSWSTLLPSHALSLTVLFAFAILLPHGLLPSSAPSSRPHPLPLIAAPHACRGVYRSAPHLWQHPGEVVPAGSHRNDRSGAMVSAMQPSGDGRFAITLTVPAALAPLTLACVVHVAPPEGAKDTAGRPLRPHFVTPLRGRHFSALIGCSPGSSAQQGVALLPPAPAAGRRAVGAAGGTAVKPSVLEFGGGAAAAAAEKHAVNFSVRCRGADRVCLVLLRPQPAAAGQQQQEWGMVELVLDPVLNRTGELWHIAGAG